VPLLVKWGCYNRDVGHEGTVTVPAQQPCHLILDKCVLSVYMRESGLASKHVLELQLLTSGL